MNYPSYNEYIIKSFHKQHTTSGKWFLYVILLLVLLSCLFYMLQQWSDHRFYKNSIQQKAKIESVDFIRRSDGSGIGFGAYAIYRVVVTFKIDHRIQRSIRDVHNQEYSEYFDYYIEDVDSLDILYDQRNPNNIRFIKLK